MMKTLKNILWEKKTWSLIQNHLRKIVNRYLTIKCMTFRKMFCYKSNDYYAENHGLKWTENLRSVQFKFTKKLNFSSVQVLFWKSELSSVQSSPKNELLNWTELFRSVRAIHCFLMNCILVHTSPEKWFEFCRQKMNSKVAPKMTTKCIPK